MAGRFHFFFFFKYSLFGFPPVGVATGPKLDLLPWLPLPCFFFTEFYLVLLGFTGFYPVFPLHYRVLPSLAVFY